jgi:hypothetical protein
MDPASLASAAVSAQMSQVQLAVAAKMLRMGADSAKSVVQLVEAAQHNMQSLANIAPGVGQNVNITA